MRKLKFENKEQEWLFYRNKGFAINLALEWNKMCEIELEELKSYALESLCTAAISYDKDKNTAFLTYAYHVININIRRELKSRNTNKRKAAKEVLPIAIDDYTNYNKNDTSESSISYRELLISIDQILNKFPKIQKEAIKKYLIERNTLNELADEYQVSMRTVHKWILKGKKELQENLVY